jgi:hypothetical protein
VSVNQQRVCHVPRYDRGVINIHIVDIVYNINALALRRICGLHDPHIFLGVMLLQFLIMSVEVAELIRQDIGIRDEIKVALAKFLLHADHIVTEPVLTSDFIALREVIYFLVLVKALIKVALATA